MIGFDGVKRGNKDTSVYLYISEAAYSPGQSNFYTTPYALSYLKESEMCNFGEDPSKTEIK